MADEMPKKDSADDRRTSKSKQTLIFISHDTRDAALAECFSKLLSSVSAGVLKSFRSSDRKGSQGIEYGVEWYPELMSQLESASDVVCLLTKHSLDRPWILYEAGVAKGKLDTPVYGVALGIPLRKANTGPFAQFQNCDDNDDSLTKLVMQLLARIPDAEPDREAILTQVTSFKTRIAEALDAPAAGPEYQQPMDDSTVAKLFEEVKVMFQDLPSRLSLQLEGHPLRIRRMRHRSHPRMLEDFESMLEPHVGPLGLLLLASRLRKELPWIYDIAVEVHRTIQRGDFDGARPTVESFHRILMHLSHGPFIHELVDSKTEYIYVRECVSALEDYCNRHLAAFLNEDYRGRRTHGDE
ncbi:MAG TPA: toll/interleukin-1 receptor domain-containing protein [Phycisphaerae bacterium]|nr:toll/interleukin-1 receptor domain-containing protein [Phycisphaerae bacterium]